MRYNNKNEIFVHLGFKRNAGKGIFYGNQSRLMVTDVKNKCMSVRHTIVKRSINLRFIKKR